jgi:hypothetical protein
LPGPVHGDVGVVAVEPARTLCLKDRRGSGSHSVL